MTDSKNTPPAVDLRPRLLPIEDIHGGASSAFAVLRDLVDSPDSGKRHFFYITDGATDEADQSASQLVTDGDELIALGVGNWVSGDLAQMLAEQGHTPESFTAQRNGGNQ